jgi:chloramphenicol 3-O-phosphotransferase
MKCDCGKKTAVAFCLPTAIQFSHAGRVDMKLVIIHGPPAAGKLTVANELAALTGFKVFHNHLSIDCTVPVFEFGSDAFWRINSTIRNETIAEAARAGIDVIHTFCYAKGPDDEGYHRLIASAEYNGATAHLVLLRCSDDERKRRIGNESRVRLRKLTDPSSIDSSKQEIDLLSPLPGRDTLIIDTTDLAPDATARRIVEHYGLLDS